LRRLQCYKYHGIYGWDDRWSFVPFSLMSIFRI
jgi:hypothetical protein